MACCQANPAPGVWGIRWVNLNTSECYFRTFQLCSWFGSQSVFPILSLTYTSVLQTHIYLYMCHCYESDTHISVWVQWWRIHYACTYSNFMNNVQIRFNLRGVSPGSCLQPPCIAIVGHMGYFFFFFWEVSMSRTKVLNVNSLTASISMRDNIAQLRAWNIVEGILYVSYDSVQSQIWTGVAIILSLYS